jgi:non-heme chloroperoxidase
MEDQAKAFESQAPQAQIVRIANADHYIFCSNEADVVQDINVFVKNLRNRK